MVLEKYTSTKSLLTGSKDEIKEKEVDNNGRDRENDEKDEGKNNY